MRYDIVVGTTNPLQFQLIESGEPIDLGSITVTLLLSNRNGTTVSSPGTVSIVDSTNGKIQFTPTNSTVFIAADGPYYARWVLTTSLGVVSYVPTSVRDTWNLVGT